MALFDRGTRFGTISIVNHWVIAGLVIIMLALGLYMDDLPRGPRQFQIVQIHKSIGALVLILALWRVAWRLIFRFPDEVATMPRWQEIAAKAAHVTLLALIIAMPFTGYISSATGGNAVTFFGLFSLPALPESKFVSGLMAGAHGLLANLLMIVLVLHIAAAVKHHFIDRDATLTRMLGRG